MIMNCLPFFTVLILQLFSFGASYQFRTNNIRSFTSNRFPVPISTLQYRKGEDTDLSSKIYGAKNAAIATDEDVQRDLKTTLAWVGAAAIFAGGIGATMGSTPAVEFVSGYLLEETLSIDNLFVFLVLFDFFGVERTNQGRILNYGIYGAMALRGIFIAAGTVALEQFHQVLLVFAAVLFVSSYSILSGSKDDEEEDLSKNWIVKLSQKYFKSTDKFDGDRFFTADGLATPMFLCLVCIELSDIVFAFDSVPAVFGVTENPFIVYTSNIFAISGLRSLFAVLSDLVSELEYLEQAVGIVLAFIATKLAGSAFNIELVTPLQSLVVVMSILGVGVGTSLYKNKKQLLE
mmetsp:Transcript_38798/g.39488  ORF Transcript_38798/g.39488 Transcript_38798/m.39488 type:complete len:347 (-) Transcript_38798:3-1043(-)